MGLPSRGSRRWVLGAAVLVLTSALAAQQAHPPAQGSTSPVVYSAEVDSIIHPASARYMIDTIDRADEANAALVVFTLRTPGGLVDSTRDIVTKMIAAKTPIAVFVAPSGARAASAGFILTIAADIAAMAPGTHIGAAHPVSGSGAVMDETTSKKAAEDVAAYVRTIAGPRGRNAQLAEQAVLQSKAFTDDEAMKATPPLIDVVATESRRSVEKARRPYRQAIRRPHRYAPHGVGDGCADPDDAPSAHPQRHRAPEHRVHPPEPGHARTDDRAVESGCGSAGRGRRPVAAARVLRAPGAADQLRRACC